MLTNDQASPLEERDPLLVLAHGEDVEARALRLDLGDRSPFGPGPQGACLTVREW
jgi:hypothetical protein